MADEPRKNYASLRQEQQKALEALHNHIEKGPERPQGHYGDRPGWTDRGDMASQQKSAADMAKYRNEQQAAARDALNQHMQGGGRQAQDQGQKQDVGRKPDDDIKR